MGRPKPNRKKSLPAKKAQQIEPVTIEPIDVGTKQVRRVISVKKQVSGPIPSPEMFLAYKEVDERLPDLIISEWQKEGDARRSFAASSSKREDRKTFVVIFFVFAMVFMAIYMAYKEQFEYATALLMCPFVFRLILGSKIKE